MLILVSYDVSTQAPGITLAGSRAYKSLIQIQLQSVSSRIPSNLCAMTPTFAERALVP